MEEDKIENIESEITEINKLVTYLHAEGNKEIFN
jgi:hypothetical protein